MATRYNSRRGHGSRLRRPNLGKAHRLRGCAAALANLKREDAHRLHRDGDTEHAEEDTDSRVADDESQV